MAYHVALQQAVAEGTRDGEDAAHAPGACPYHNTSGRLDPAPLICSVGFVVVRQLDSCMHTGMRRAPAQPSFHGGQVQDALCCTRSCDMPG